MTAVQLSWLSNQDAR